MAASMSITSACMFSANVIADDGVEADGVVSGSSTYDETDIIASDSSAEAGKIDAAIDGDLIYKNSSLIFKPDDAYLSIIGENNIFCTLTSESGEVFSYSLSNSYSPGQWTGYGESLQEGTYTYELYSTSYISVSENK